jgi:hypothetical protein
LFVCNFEFDFSFLHVILLCGVSMAGDYPTLEAWLPVALSKAFQVASLHFPGKRLYGEWVFHHDFDAKMVLPELPQVSPSL